MARIDVFLDLVVKQGGSDLHLVAGNPPRIRLHGESYTVKYRELGEKETKELIDEITPPHVMEYFAEAGNADFAYELEGVSRFRVNIFKHQGGMGAILRAIPTDIKSLQQLGLPPILKNLSRQRKGLILVTGPTGSGKSTTLAAIVDAINEERKGHIITIEDPVEFLHRNKNCLVSQREVGFHAKTFAQALHSAMREDPDTILVGEMRDLETIHLALTAAEMGVLVIATLHTNSAAATVDRIINVFPPGEEPFVRTMLSTSLCGIISQQLIRRADGKGRVVALEIMVNSSAVSNAIREGKSDQLENIIQGGGMQGMQLMDTALLRLVDAKTIGGDQAYLHCKNKSQFAHLRDELELADDPVFSG